MSSNQTNKPSEGKREKLRKYLENHGVMDALTEVLVNLYKETNKPDDAQEYIRDELAIYSGVDTLKQMQAKLEYAQDQINQMEEEIDNLKTALEEKQREKIAEEHDSQEPAPKPEE